jgi:hypothetical protein
MGLSCGGLPGWFMRLGDFFFFLFSLGRSLVAAGIMHVRFQKWRAPTILLLISFVSLETYS